MIPEPDAAGAPRAGARPSSSRAFLVIIAAYVLVQSFTVARSVAPARDGARYLSYALVLDAEPWRDVLRTRDDHPGYPLFLHGVFRAGAICGWTSPRARLLLAQAATSAAGLLFVIASFFAVRRLWGPSVAAGAMLAFVFLPRPAMNLADVLSDPLHAAFWMASALAFLRALAGWRPAGFALAGLLAALAYWVRIDAFILAAASLVTLGAVILARRPAGSRERREAALAAFAYLATFAAGLGLFVLACGELSPEPVSGIFLIGAAPAAPSGMVLAAALSPTDVQAIAAAAWQVIRDLAQVTQGVHLATAGIAAAFALKRRPRLAPPSTFVLSAFLITGAILVVVGWKAGYLSSRYFLPVLPFVVGFGMHGVLLLHGRWRPLALRRGWPAGSSRACLAATIAASLAASLPSLLGRRLHDNSHGLVQAAEFIAASIPEGAAVVDPYFYPTYLAGRRAAPAAPRADGSTPRFFVAEDRDLPDLKELEQALREGKVEALAEFTRLADGGGGKVRVYRERR